MGSITLKTMNIAYLYRYNILYDLISSFITRELKLNDLYLHQFHSTDSLLQSVERYEMDIVIIHSSCLFDGASSEAEIRKLLSELRNNKRTITVFFAQNMKSALLKKIVLSGMDIMFSSRDTPQELVLALVSMMNKSLPGRYISKTIRENLQKNDNALTPKEWEVINLISQGYSLSEIASKKCRAMSTISTQKRNAMNKLHLKNESELLCFLHQNTFF